MKQRSFTVTLVDDLVLSASSATSGGHQTLDYLPGSVFLGAVAARLYARLGEDAWWIFHSGQVRFCNALPLQADGQLGLPMPLSLYTPKYPSTETASTLVNRSRSSWDQPGLQPKQLRAGFLLGDGTTLHPEKGYRLKTAIDRQKGYRAREGQLFGYQYLEAGSRWFMRLQADDDLSDDLLDQLETALTGGGIRLGRSRSAEFGRVRIEPAGSPDWPESTTEPDRHLLLYCLSDLALRDPVTGMPTLKPASSLLGLPAGEFKAESSHLRFRSYAPFNAYRGANDLERQVITAGSVLAFELEQPLGLQEQTELQQQLAAGAGDYRQDGLGQIWLNPPFLAGKHFVPFDLRLSGKTTTEASAMSEAEHELCAWLTASAGESVQETKARETARIWASKVTLVSEGPSASQWRSLADEAAACQALSALKAELFDPTEGMCTHGVSQKQWQTEWRFGQSYKNLLEECLAETEGTEPATACLALVHFGRMMAAKVRQEETK